MYCDKCNEHISGNSGTVLCGKCNRSNEYGLRKLAKAQDKLLAAYRTGKQPSGNVLDTITRYKRLLDDST